MRADDVVDGAIDLKSLPKDADFVRDWRDFGGTAS